MSTLRVEPPALTSYSGQIERARDDVQVASEYITKNATDGTGGELFGIANEGNQHAVETIRGTFYRLMCLLDYSAPELRTAAGYYQKTDLSECLRGLLFGRAECSTPLPGGGPAAVEPAGHSVDRCPADQGLGDRGIAFVVAGQPAVCGQPGEAAFYHPPFRMNNESLLVRRLTNDLHGGLECVGSPADEATGETLVGEHVPDRRCPKWKGRAFQGGRVCGCGGDRSG